MVMINKELLNCVCVQTKKTFDGDINGQSLNMPLPKPFVLMCWPGLGGEGQNLIAI